MRLLHRHGLKAREALITPRPMRRDDRRAGGRSGVHLFSTEANNLAVKGVAEPGANAART